MNSTCAGQVSLPHFPAAKCGKVSLCLCSALSEKAKTDEPENCFFECAHDFELNVFVSNYKVHILLYENAIYCKLLK